MISVVRHGERVNMGRAGGENWFNDPKWRFEPVKLSTGRTIHPEDMDWNVPLSVGGATDARSAGRRLADRVKQGRGQVDHIFCSPSWRCQQTAHYMAVELGIKFKSVAGLHECYREGNGFADAAARRFGKQAIPPWLTNKELGEMNMAVDADFVDESPPTKVYESVPAYFMRMRKTIKWLCNNCTGNFVIAGHLASGAIVRLILERPEVKELDKDLLNNMPGLRVIPGSITTVKSDANCWKFHDLDDAQFLWADRKAQGGALEMAQMNGHGNPVLCCVASRSGSIVVSGSADNSLRVWDIMNGRCAGTLHGHERPVLCCDISPNGETIVSGSHDAEIRFWKSDAERIAAGEPPDLQCTLEIPGAHLKPVRCVKYSADGVWLASGSYDKSVRLWTKSGHNATEMIGHKGTVRALSWHPYAQVLASAGEDKKILFWDCSGISASPSRMSDPPTPTVLVAHEAAVVTVAYSPDGELLVSGSYDGTLKVWSDVMPGKKAQLKLTIDAHPGKHVQNATWARDASRLVSCSDDESIKVWEPNTGELLVTLTGHRKSVLQVDFAGADMLLSSSEDNTCRLWDVSDTAVATHKRDNELIAAAAAEAAEAAEAAAAEAAESESVDEQPDSPSKQVATKGGTQVAAKGGTQVATKGGTQVATQGGKQVTKGGTVVDSAVTNQRTGALTDVSATDGGTDGKEVAGEARMKTFAEQERLAMEEKELLEMEKKDVNRMRQQADKKFEEKDQEWSTNSNKMADKLKDLCNALENIEQDLSIFAKQCDVKKVILEEPVIRSARSSPRLGPYSR